MTKDDIIGRIITLVHAEVRNITPSIDPVAEGRSNAPARTSILERLVNDISKDSPDGLVDLMEVLNDRRPSEVYPEVRLLQQWQNMSILDTPMDSYYTADLLFSKQRAGLTLADSEIKDLSALANPNSPHPWPTGFTPPVPAVQVSAPQTSMAVPEDTSSSVAALSVEERIEPLLALRENDAAAQAGAPTQPASPADVPAPSIIKVLVDVEDVLSSVPTPGTVSVLVAEEEDAPAQAPAEERVRSNPVASYQEKRGMIEDVALANGMAVMSGKEWRTAKMPRTQALLVADFDFATVDKEGVGRAAYLLVGPTVSTDVRIELKSQSTSGSAGDKLPTSLLRLVNASRSQSYGSAVVGVVGLQYVAPEALTLAREVAGRSSRIRLAEGTENFIDVVQQNIDNIKALHTAATPSVTVPVAQTPIAPTTSLYVPTSKMDDAASGGPGLYS